MTTATNILRSIDGYSVTTKPRHDQQGELCGFDVLIGHTTYARVEMIESEAVAAALDWHNGIQQAYLDMCARWPVAPIIDDEDALYECVQCGHKCRESEIDYPGESVSVCPGCGGEDTYCEVKEADEEVDA